MKCTELLTQDHIIIRRGLDIVDAMLKKLQEGQRIEIADIKTILKFLRLFADQYHQVMEETVLFPALLLAAPDDTALLQLASEHAGERTLVDAIEEALLSRRGMAFFRSSRQLTALLRSHCEKEDAIVYTLAERYLSKELDDEIAVDFMANRAEAESHANLSRLEARYLPKPSPDPSRPHHGFARTRGSASYG